MVERQKDGTGKELLPVVLAAAAGGFISVSILHLRLLLRMEEPRKAGKGDGNMKILSYFSCLLSTSLYLKSHYVNYDEVNRTQLLFIIITSSRVSRQLRVWSGVRGTSCKMNLLHVQAGEFLGRELASNSTNSIREGPGARRAPH